VQVSPLSGSHRPDVLRENDSKKLNKNAVALQRHGGMKRRKSVQATGAIPGSPSQINPRTPIYKVLLLDRSYRIVAAL